MPKGHPLTKTEKAEILERYKDDTRGHIASDLNLHPYTINKFLKSKNITD